MKIQSLNQAVCRAICGGALLLQAAVAVAQVTTYHVNVETPSLTLYTDPYNGNKIRVGGFSGIYPVPGQTDKFFVVSDRGPAPDFTDAGGTAFKTFAVPGFGPHIMTVRLMPNGTARIDDLKPLKRPDHTHISGIPTSRPATDVPYDLNLNQLPYDEDTIDAEGFTIDPWGNYWVCDEYKPAVAMVARNGTVKMKLVPAGTLTGSERVPTYDVLPGVLAKRRNNRGLEGIAASPDGILYSIMQRPLNNPNRAAADTNGNIRLVAVNLNTLLNNGPAPLVQQFLYRVATNFNNVTLSDLYCPGPGRLLVPERVTDAIFEVNLAGATDITPLENAAGRLIDDPSKTIESLATDALAERNIVPVTKTLVLGSLTSIDPVLEKIEGICMVGNTLVFTYDNDFNVAELGIIPANPNPDGPFVEIGLVGSNYPRIYTLPLK